MTRRYLAAILHCREVGEEMTAEEIERAAANNLVAIFGQSCFDLVMRGAVNMELPAWEPVYLTLGGEFLTEKTVVDTVVACGMTDRLIKARWKPEHLSADWFVTTKLPHSRFDTFEDGRFFCRGIVIDLNEIKEFI